MGLQGPLQRQNAFLHQPHLPRRASRAPRYSARTAHRRGAAGCRSSPHSGLRFGRHWDGVTRRGLPPKVRHTAATYLCSSTPRALCDMKKKINRPWKGACQGIHPGFPDRHARNRWQCTTLGHEPQWCPQIGQLHSTTNGGKGPTPCLHTNRHLQFIQRNQSPGSTGRVSKGSPYPGGHALFLAPTTSDSGNTSAGGGARHAYHPSLQCNSHKVTQ